MAIGCVIRTAGSSIVCENLKNFHKNGLSTFNLLIPVEVFCQDENYITNPLLQIESVSGSEVLLFFCNCAITLFARGSEVFTNYQYDLEFAPPWYVQLYNQAGVYILQRLSIIADIL